MDAGYRMYIYTSVAPFERTVQHRSQPIQIVNQTATQLLSYSAGMAADLTCLSQYGTYGIPYPACSSPVTTTKSRTQTRCWPNRSIRRQRPFRQIHRGQKMVETGNFPKLIRPFALFYVVCEFP